MFSLTLDSRKVDFNNPVVMGIINATPDSFFENSRTKNIREVLQKAEMMLEQGATFIDIGGQSTRPQSKLVSEEEELNRVIPFVEAVKKEFPNCYISIDTFYSSVARAAVDKGASLINDISAGNIDNKMFETVSRLQVPYICMHMIGTPQTMQQNTHYNNLLLDIEEYFEQKINQANELKIEDLVLDLGIGFSKTIEQNFELIKNLKMFKKFEKPLLVGVSRKSFIYKTLNTDADNALNGTTVLNTIAILNSADILRVHDVKEAIECIKLTSHTK